MKRLIVYVPDEVNAVSVTAINFRESAMVVGCYALTGSTTEIKDIAAKFDE